MPRLLALLAPLMFVVVTGVAAQQPTARLESEPSREMRMEVGETQLMHLSTKVVRVSVADPEVADVQVVTPQQVLITAKSVGYTHLILWGANEEPLVVAVAVNRNLDQLRAQFTELFPGQDIKVSAVDDLIVLSGTVSDLRLPARAAEVASLHTERLANLIKVTGDQQVQLDVRFAEVSRTGLRRAGVNFLWRDTQRGYVGGYSSAGTAPGQYLTQRQFVPGTGGGTAPPLVPAPVASDGFNFFFSTGLSDFPFSAILSIMREEGLAKVLAEPSLVALSGQDAEFHAGGEVPILLAQQLGQVSVRYKKFGVRLNFTPTVLSDRTMSLAMRVEVSEPDPAAGVVLGGFQVPGFKTRTSETTIRLRDGQSFAIAGLLSDQVRSLISKVPGLGDLPLLGALFRSSSYQRDETELLMVVTARLVRPLQPDDTPLMPGEGEYNDPNDFELFILGYVDTDDVEDYEKRRRERQQASAPRAQVKPSPRPARGSTPPEQAAPKRDTAPQPPPAAPEPPPASGDQTEVSPSGIETTDGRALEGPLGPIGFIRG
ncbi:MAG: type II and III secretion system protein family protein [Myxococcales bacterium]|jgi:pilus assembly protein CpaC